MYIKNQIKAPPRKMKIGSAQHLPIRSHLLKGRCKPPSNLRKIIDIINRKEKVGWPSKG